MKNTGFILKLALILFAIAFVCTFVLVLCNNITAPVIAENTKLAEEQARVTVLPTAKSFEAVSLDATGVTESYIGKDKDGNTAGYCFKISTNANKNKAFGGEIQMIVGIDSDLNITGVEITSMAETPGLGAKAGEKEFKGQFVGKTGEITVKSGDNSISAISGATITSKAVTEGVNNAIKAAQALKGKEAK